MKILAIVGSPRPKGNTSILTDVALQEVARHGLETEKIFAALVIAGLSRQPFQAADVAAVLEERDRRLLFEILFEEASEPTWEEALSCIELLQHRQAEQELAEVQRSIEASPAGSTLRDLLTRKQELMRRLAAAR